MTALEGGLFTNHVQREVCVGPVVEVVSLGEAPLAVFGGSTDNLLKALRSDLRSPLSPLSPSSGREHMMFGIEPPRYILLSIPPRSL